MMSKISLILTLVALPLVFVIEGQSGSCRSNKVSNRQTEMTDKVAAGVWGGEHIQLQVTESGASIEYDCAHGTIDQPLMLDAQGRFDVKGTHVREHGGPVRRDDKPNSHLARYTGSVESKTMTLTVTLTDAQDASNTYTLTQGEQGRLFKCR
jgi:hypothetical protein